jgi:hypothetical protein
MVMELNLERWMPHVITEAEHTLLDAFHTHQTDDIRVPREALNTYVAETGAKLPGDLVVREPRSGSTTVEVRREALWTLLTGLPYVKRKWNK